MDASLNQETSVHFNLLVDLLNSCAAWKCCMLREGVSNLFKSLFGGHRWRVYLVPRCLHLGLWWRCQYQRTQQRPISRWQLAKLNTMQHLTAWFGSEIFFLSIPLFPSALAVSSLSFCLFLLKDYVFEVIWVCYVINWSLYWSWISNLNGSIRVKLFQYNNFRFF